MKKNIERTIQLFDGLKMIETESKKVALKKGAVPSIFPNCPSYLTDATASCQRLYLDDKEERRIQETYKKSLAEFKETKAKFTISTLNCIKIVSSRTPCRLDYLLTKSYSHPFS